MSVAGCLAQIHVWRLALPSGSSSSMPLTLALTEAELMITWSSAMAGLMWPQANPMAASYQPRGLSNLIAAFVVLSVLLCLLSCFAKNRNHHLFMQFGLEQTRAAAYGAGSGASG